VIEEDLMKRAYVDPRAVGVVLLLAVAPSLAQAYIDPGNGAYMVQALFAMAGAALFYIRHPIRTVKSCWNWLLNRKQKLTTAADPVAASNESVNSKGLDPLTRQE
jgi:hypothetical protein